MNETWKKAQEWELDWHGNCVNSFHEEEKQFVYAEKMGLVKAPTPKTPHNFDLRGKSILDIGGGAYSLLLKCVNFDGVVADPLMGEYPEWVRDRYRELGIVPAESTGEKMLGGTTKRFDEVWIYNVLEHVIDPKMIIENALELGKVVRIFEWLGIEPNIGHPHTLKAKKLDEWLGGKGKVEEIDREGAVGLCYYGVFKGNHYE